MKLRPRPHASGQFTNTSLLSALCWRSHVDGGFGHRKRRFLKTYSKGDLFENAVSNLSCGRVKTELFEKANVIASIYHLSELKFGLWASREGILFACFRISNLTAFSVEHDISKTLLVWMRILFNTEKKIRFQSIRLRVDAAWDTCTNMVAMHADSHRTSKH